MGIVNTFRFGGTVIQRFEPKCKNSTTGVNVHYVIENPGSKYYLGVGPDKKAQDGLLRVADAISGKLAAACTKALDDYKSTNTQCEFRIGKLWVRANSKGLAIESDPPPGRFASDPNP